MEKKKGEMAQILDIANEFLKIPCVIHNEAPFLNYLDKKIKGLGYNTTLKERYLVVRPKGSETKSKVLFSAHIDRHGLILNENENVEYSGFYYKRKFNIPFARDEIETHEQDLVQNLNVKLHNDINVKLDDTYLLFTQKNKPVLKFTRVGSAEFFEKVGIRHVRESITSYDPKTGETISNYKTLRYCVNFENKEVIYILDKPLKNINKEKVFMLNSIIIEDETYFSGQLDNVISVAVLYYILKSIDFTQEIIFTTQEEIGLSYENVLEYMKENNSNLSLVVLDVSPYTDFSDKEDGFLTLRYGDEKGGFNKNLVEKTKVILENQNIPYDFKPSYLGKTELGKVSFYTKGKINGTTLQLPTLNYHTTYETLSKKGLKNYYKAIKCILND